MTALACVAIVMSIVALLVEPKPIPGIDATQRQDAETTLYLAAFGVILPLSLVAAPRLVDSVAAGRNGRGLSALAGLLCGAFAAAILVVRLAGGGIEVLLAAAAVWSAGAVLALRRAARGADWPPLLAVAAAAPWIWVAAGALALGDVLTVTHLDSMAVLPLALGVVLVAVVVRLAGRFRVPELRAGWGALADAACTAALSLAVVDMLIIQPENRGASDITRLREIVVQFHHDLLLIPANQVLGGSAVLVDTASQYGVASVYLLAGWFELFPIGYGSYGLLDGVLTALSFAAGFFILRLAGCSRLLSAAALAVGVAVLVYNRVYPVGDLPQEGPFRFGLPLALVLAVVAGARWPRWSAAARATGLAVLALSSVWALEAFAYTAATFAGMAGFQAYLLPPGRRLRRVGRQALQALAACVSAQLLFAAATLAAAGQLPEWGQYFDYLHAFLVGHLGDITYDFGPWSPGLAVGAAYLASAAALVLIVRRRRDLVDRAFVSLLALSGLTTYGIVFYAYFVDRSADGLLVYVCLPALLAGALWLSLLLRFATGLLRSGGLAFALAVALVLVSVSWSSIGPAYDRSALAHSLSGPDSARAALHRLRHFPPIRSRAPRGVELLDRYMPGERHSIVLAQHDLNTEILIRSGRANRLPLPGEPWNDRSLVRAHLPALRDAIARLRPGDRLLLNRQTPAREPLERWTLREIERRFRLEPVHRDSQGFVVATLRRR